MKINYFGVVAAVLSVASIGLQWFYFSADSLDGMLRIEFTVYLYMVQGAVNGIPEATFPLVWFIIAALALMIATFLVCLAGIFSIKRRSQLLLLSSGALSMLAVVVFGSGLLVSGYASPAQQPGLIMRLFPVYAFGQTSAAIAMQSTYRFVWWLCYGFWLAVAASIFAFIAAIAPSLKKKIVA